MNTNLIGKEIKIIAMPGDPQEADYIGRTGIVKSVDSAGQLHGTWGGLAIIPEHDTFEVLGEETARYANDIWEAVDDPLNLDFDIKKDDEELITEGIFDKKPPFNTPITNDGQTLKIGDTIYIAKVNFNKKALHYNDSANSYAKRLKNIGKIEKIKGGLIYGTWGPESIAPNRTSQYDEADSVYKVEFLPNEYVEVSRGPIQGFGWVDSYKDIQSQLAYYVQYYPDKPTKKFINNVDELQQPCYFMGGDRMEINAISKDEFIKRVAELKANNDKIQSKSTASATKPTEEFKELQTTKDSNGHNVTKGDTVKITKARNNVKKFEGQTGTITTIIDYPNVGDGIVVKFTSEKDKAGFAIKAGDKFEKVETNKMTMKVKPVQQKEKEEEEPATLHF